MMTQLTNKEILYEPMKELHDKFPAWMAKQEGGKGEVGKEDMARYVEQQRLVGEIVARFETKGYRDENEGDREYIVERMQKVSPWYPWIRLSDDSCADVKRVDASSGIAASRFGWRHECSARSAGGDGRGMSDAIIGQLRCSVNAVKLL